jgi:hypothetical protein
MNERVAFFRLDAASTVGGEPRVVQTPMPSPEPRQRSVA